MQTIDFWGCGVGMEGGNRQNTGFLGHENTLYDMIMVNTITLHLVKSIECITLREKTHV